MSVNENNIDGSAEATETAAEPVRKQNRKEYMARYYAENKDEINARRKAVRIARREEVIAAERERYATDPAYQEYRKKLSAEERKRKKERIATDPVAKKQNEERLAKRRQRHKERLATDPEYQRKIETYKTALREKRRKQKTEGGKP